MTVLEASSVLFVHAHPDDETIGSGVLVAELVSRGASVSLLTATRGEQGEVVPGPLSHLVGTPALARERERELECACERLGIERLLWLGTPPARAADRKPRGYEDSGMRWIEDGLAGPAADVGPGAFTSASFEEVVADIAAAIRSVGPSIVLSEDESGGYGHPDHVLAHYAALAASRELGVPFAEILHSPAEDAEWLDLTARRDAVIPALRCFASQLTVEGTQIVHSGGQRMPMFTELGLRMR